jgi:hypothetical protein
MSMASKLPTVERRIFMGIGDAVLRLIHVERMYADGVDPGDQLIAERGLIVQALNQQYQLDLGMDCDMDGIPDSIDDDVSVLTTAAQTSCCRIIPEGGVRSPSSRVEPLPTPSADSDTPKTSRKKSSSRKRASAAAKKAPTAPKKAPTAPKKAPTAPKKATKQRSSRKAAPKKAAPKKAAPKKPVAPVKKKKGLLSSLFGSDEEK